MLAQEKDSNDCNSKANSGTPVLGICLGMQLLGKSSDEGITAGLASLRKYPHMGTMKYFKMTYVDVKSIRLLNYIDYSKTNAIKELNEKFGY